MDAFEQINVHEAGQMIGAKAVTVVDIRDEDSFRARHIDGAIWINDRNMERFLSEADRTKPLICYCYHGFSSQSAAVFFKTQGFEKVYSLIGGFEEWRKNF